MDLTDFIKSLNVLNLDANDSMPIDDFKLQHITSIDDSKYIVSDADEELLLLFEFNKSINLKSIQLHALSATMKKNSTDHCNLSQPKLIHIYKRDNLNINFDDISSIKPDISCECKPNKLNKGQIIKLQKQPTNAIKFKTTKYLVVYIKSNQSDTEVTYLNSISFKTDKKKMETEHLLVTHKDAKSKKKYTELEIEINSMILQNNYNLNEHSADYKKIKSNGQRIVFRNNACNLSNCISFQRLSATLERYHAFEAAMDEESKGEEMFDLFFGDQYDGVRVLNDFHHLLTVHKADYEDIYNKLVITCNELNSCSLDKCVIIKRNYRDRHLDRNDVSNKLNVIHNEVSIAIQQSLLDKIHCYFFHSFDIGYKIKENDQKILLQTEMKNNDDDYKNDIHSFNKIDHDIHKLINSNRKLRENVQGLERIKCKTNNNRFNTPIDEIIYDHGVKYFYWDYYKDKNEVNDTSMLVNDFMFGTGGTVKSGDIVEANQGYSVQQWYIKKKYKDLKDELLNNKICIISKQQWDHLEKQAMQHLQSEYAKSIRCRQVKEYETIPGDALKLYHLMAMMAYCNQDMLQASFSKTYRRKRNETDLKLKERHSNFANFGRYLREMTDCYGQHGINGPLLGDQILWHGISQKTRFATINPCFKGPFSSTLDYAVAVNFSNKTGSILQFRLNTKWLFTRGFMNGNDIGAFVDCSWLSDYPNEQERFFIGGYARFYIDTIIMAPDTNYSEYITATRGILDKFKTVSILQPVTVLSNITSQIAFRLLSHECHKRWPKNPMYHKFKSIPKYIDTLFHNFCKNLTSLVIFGLKRGGSSYEIMDKLLDTLFLDDNGMIKLDVIITLFSSVRDVVIEPNYNGDNNDNLDLIDNDDFWNMLLSVLPKPRGLKEMFIRFIFNDGCKSIIEEKQQKYGLQLLLIGWRIMLVSTNKYSKPEYTLIIASENDGRGKIKNTIATGTDQYTAYN